MGCRKPENNESARLVPSESRVWGKKKKSITVTFLNPLNCFSRKSHSTRDPDFPSLRPPSVVAMFQGGLCRARVLLQILQEADWTSFMPCPHRRQDLLPTPPPPLSPTRLLSSVYTRPRSTPVLSLHCSMQHQPLFLISRPVWVPLSPMSPAFSRKRDALTSRWRLGTFVRLGPSASDTLLFGEGG